MVLCVQKMCVAAATTAVVAAAAGAAAAVEVYSISRVSCVVKQPVCKVVMLQTMLLLLLLL
jgi:hypothetical protein